MHTLPFRYFDLPDYPFKRLIIEPTLQAEEITLSGLTIPAHDLNESEVGKVVYCDKDSTFKPGDEVQYKKFDRANTEKLESILIDDKNYDVVYEHKISCVNDKPYNQVFVKLVSDFSVGEDQLIIPEDVYSVTRKGVIFDAPDYFHVKKGDRIEYYTPLKGFYPQANIDGEVYECIQEQDIFVINGEVSPYRMIVKIDLAAQSMKRSSTHSGLRLSPLFIAMLRNLQYGEIKSIGTEAQKLYPNLAAGDTIIFDHNIESEDYRLIQQDLSKVNPDKHPIFEYRIINCYDFSQREILGKLSHNKQTKEIINIEPINNSVFLRFEFEHFDQDKKSDLISADDRIIQYKNKPDLQNVLDHKRKLAAETAKMKMSGIKQYMSRLNPISQQEEWQFQAGMLQKVEREEKRIAAALRSDLWLVCQTIFPKRTPKYMISPWEQLYPINILGRKFLIGHPDFLLFQTDKNMNIQTQDLIALADNVLVLPIEGEQETQLIIPDAAKSKPQYGKVVAIGESKDGVKAGDFVLYRQYAGLQQQVGGVDHLIMKQNDLLAIVPERKNNLVASDGEGI